LGIDFFVSHASEDKETVARPLADELHRRGFEVWYDEYSLRVGDSLNEKINDGLSRARFAVVIISPDFMAKDWTRRELDGLVAVDRDGRKGHILPVWHDVTEPVVRAWAPMLAGLHATSTSRGIPVVADDLVAVAQVNQAPQLPRAVLPAGARQLPAAADDTQDLLQRAQDAVPQPSGTAGAGTVLLAVSAGPSTVILRPAQLRDSSVHGVLLQLAILSNAPVLDLSNATRTEHTPRSVTLRQDRAFVTVDSRGTVAVGGPASEDPRAMLPTIIEEDIRDRLERAIRFTARVLDRFDGQGRLTHLTPIAALVGAGAIGWRTRAEHQANPNSMRISSGLMRSGHSTRLLARLDPPVRPRTALEAEAATLAEDLTVHLEAEVNVR
jgi:hypothetical protein